MQHPQGSWFAHEFKTTITSAAVGSSTPGILTPERMAQIVKPGVESFRMRDLIPRFPTNNNSVEWVKGKRLHQQRIADGGNDLEARIGFDLHDRQRSRENFGSLDTGQQSGAR
jgi:hypothetical protein